MERQKAPKHDMSGSNRANSRRNPQGRGSSVLQANGFLWIGVCAGLSTLAYFMYLALHPAIECDNRFPALFVMALGTALSGGLIGGWARLNGRLPPIGDGASATVVSAGGGAALFLAVLVVGNFVYRCEVPTPPPIPGGAGWILAGKIRLDPTGRPQMKEGRIIWATGPVYVVLKTTNEARDGLPAVGDLVRLTDERNVRIVDFQLSGTSKSRVRPHVKGTLTDADKTGVVLLKGTRVEISDVDTGYYPGEPDAFVWIRVSTSS